MAQDAPYRVQVDAAIGQARKAVLAALLPGYQFPRCDAVCARGLDPLHSYEPSYTENMDGDGDGTACEPYP
jgi:hypothetical protein